MLRRFYFDLDNNQVTIRDDEGVEAEDLEQALAEVRSVINEMANELGATDLDNPWTLIVRDETGLPIAHVPIGVFSSSHLLPGRN
jgi:predicted mannosyl-3-phosphoglycerate phosphatase (HAD superfamily)